MGIGGGYKWEWKTNRGRAAIKALQQDGRGGPHPRRGQGPKRCKGEESERGEARSFQRRIKRRQQKFVFCSDRETRSEKLRWGGMHERQVLCEGRECVAGAEPRRHRMYDI